MVVGITGGIGCGKSMVSQIINLMGFPVYDSDTNAKKLTDENAEIRRKLTELFGAELYKNNRLDRAFLAQHIFSDTQARQTVNAIIHPAVLTDFVQWSQKQTAPIVCIESAILFESGFDKYVDKILFVSAPMDLRIKRIQQRDKANATDIQRRMAAQSSDEALQKKSHFIVKNDEKHSLIKQITKIFSDLENR